MHGYIRKKMRQTRTKTEQLEWRRNKIEELSIKGFGLTDISIYFNHLNLSILHNELVFF